MKERELVGWIEVWNWIGIAAMLVPSLPPQYESIGTTFLSQAGLVTWIMTTVVAVITSLRVGATATQEMIGLAAHLALGVLPLSFLDWAQWPGMWIVPCSIAVIFWTGPWAMLMSGLDDPRSRGKDPGRAPGGGWKMVRAAVTPGTNEKGDAPLVFFPCARLITSFADTPPTQLLPFSASGWICGRVTSPSLLRAFYMEHVIGCIVLLFLHSDFSGTGWMSMGVLGGGLGSMYLFAKTELLAGIEHDTGGIGWMMFRAVWRPAGCPWMMRAGILGAFHGATALAMANNALGANEGAIVGAYLGILAAVQVGLGLVQGFMARVAGPEEEAGATGVAVTIGSLLLHTVLIWKTLTVEVEALSPFGRAVSVMWWVQGWTVMAVMLGVHLPAIAPIFLRAKSESGLLVMLIGGYAFSGLIIAGVGDAAPTALPRFGSEFGLVSSGLSWQVYLLWGAVMGFGLLAGLATSSGVIPESFYGSGLGAGRVLILMASWLQFVPFALPLIPVVAWVWRQVERVVGAAIVDYVTTCLVGKPKRRREAKRSLHFSSAEPVAV